MPGFGGLGVNRRVIFCMPEGANYYGRRLTVVDYDFLKIAAIIFPIPHVLPEPCYPGDPIYKNMGIIEYQS